MQQVESQKGIAINQAYDEWTRKNNPNEYSEKLKLQKDFDTYNSANSEEDKQEVEQLLQEPGTKKKEEQIPQQKIDEKNKNIVVENQR